ncbi:pentatricopeptide repeat (PPR) superfamily protein [Tasmannia lanceolata]|uniref:pentatricopeptide repeat (PPR) superfamily protein n=1 Tax=Tasmannia lanceolata TaxID=3420 RepID=UPI00406498F3
MISLHFPHFCKPSSIKWRSKTPMKNPQHRYLKYPPHLSPPFKSYSANSQNNSTEHTTLLVESFHQNQKLKALVEKLRAKDLNPLHLLRHEGDWTKEQFWVVMKFLKETDRMKEALQVFDSWKNIEKSRINEVNYAKVIGLLSTAGLIGEAVSTLKEMNLYGLRPSVEIYNSIIHGFAQKGEFDNARIFLKEMVENDLMPQPDTYDGLIQVYGNYRMYDEMCKCLKKMESEGCVPDHVTYNILIRSFAQGGLLQKMEGVYQKLLSKRMGLQSSSLIAMLEAYANLGILDKMEKVYRRILNSEIYIKEGLIRKMAEVYIENYRFSRLEEFGIETAERTGRTYLVWCLLLLSSACLLSRKGMESVFQEMGVAKVRLNITFVNIFALAYLKMKAFRHLDTLLSQLQSQNIKPDIVTVGVAYDVFVSSSHRAKTLEVWRRMGLLEEVVEMKTDPLVLTAFGKGFFLRSCEELYSALGSKAREKKVWTYDDLIDLVSKTNVGKPHLMQVKQDLKYRSVSKHAANSHF